MSQIRGSWVCMHGVTKCFSIVHCNMILVWHMNNMKCYLFETSNYCKYFVILPKVYSKDAALFQVIARMKSF